MLPADDDWQINLHWQDENKESDHSDQLISKQTEHDQFNMHIGLVKLKKSA